MVQTGVLVDDQGHPRISNFEFAHMSDLNTPLYSDNLMGTMLYMAPEVLEDDEPETEEEIGLKLYTKESDIYAFAYICLEVFFLRYFTI